MPAISIGQAAEKTALASIQQAIAVISAANCDQAAEAISHDSSDTRIVDPHGGESNFVRTEYRRATSLRRGPDGDPVKHDILGEIERPAGDVFDGVATIRHGQRDIKIEMSRDDGSFETTLELAAEVVRLLTELDKIAKQVAVAELREIYNSGWNEYDEVQQDGSLKAVSNAQLSESEFEAKLSLIAVNVTGDRMIDFFYEDEGMFWGHSVVVCSSKGVDLSEAHAELSG